MTLKANGMKRKDNLAGLPSIVMTGLGEIIEWIPVGLRAAQGGRIGSIKKVDL